MKTIEFLGQARAGKTTQILRLKEYLEKHGHTVAVSLDRERAREVHAPVSENLAFNLIFHSKVIDEYYQHKRTTDFFLVDRGFCDVAVWAEVLLRMKRITATEREGYANCWKRFRNLVDLTFYFKVPIKTLFERQKTLEKEEVDEVVMNQEWTKTLEEVYELQKMDFPHCVEIDGLKSGQETAIKIQREVETLI